MCVCVHGRSDVSCPCCQMVKSVMYQSSDIKYTRLGESFHAAPSIHSVTKLFTSTKRFRRRARRELPHVAAHTTRAHVTTGEAWRDRYIGPLSCVRLSRRQQKTFDRSHWQYYRLHHVFLLYTYIFLHIHTYTRATHVTHLRHVGEQ